MIKKRVMLAYEYNDGSSLWRIPCDCHDPWHDCTLYFEVPEDGIGATLNLEMPLEFTLDYNRSWWYNFKRRVKTAAKILFQGHVRLSGDVILNDDGIEGLKYALTEGQKFIRKAKNVRQL